LCENTHHSIPLDHAAVVQTAAFSRSFWDLKNIFFNVLDGDELVNQDGEDELVNQDGDEVVNQDGDELENQDGLQIVDGDDQIVQEDDLLSLASMDLSFDMDPDNNDKPKPKDGVVNLNGSFNLQDVANDEPKDVKINQESKGVEQCSQVKEKVFLTQAAQVSSTEHAFAGCKFENCTFNFILKK
jgi:hypothetical protein